MVGGNIGSSVNGGKLVLGGSNFFMLSLCQNTKAPKLLVKLFHKLGDPGIDGAVIVIVHLLTLGGLCAHESTSAEDKVGPLFVDLAVHEKILLLCANVGLNSAAIGAEKLHDTHSLYLNCLHGAQKRGLFVQRGTAVGAIGRGDTERIVLYKSVGGGIPCGIAAGLKGGAETAGGERAGIGLALYKAFAGKLHNNAASPVRGDKAVVFFGGYSVKRLEPVGVVGGTQFNCPIPHGGGNNVGYVKLKGSSLGNSALERGVNVRRQTLFHDLVVKDHASKQFRYILHNALSFYVNSTYISVYRLTHFHRICQELDVT